MPRSNESDDFMQVPGDWVCHEAMSEAIMRRNDASIKLLSGVRDDEEEDDPMAEPIITPGAQVFCPF